MRTFLLSDRAPALLWATAAAGLVIFGMALALFMLPYSAVIAENGGKSLTCLHVPFTVQRAASIIDSYDGAAREAARKLHFPGDTLFPVGYALLYGALTGLVVRRQDGSWLRVGLVVMFFPAAAMVLDWVENAHIVSMIRIPEGGTTADIPAWMPLTGGIAGSLKYLLLSGLTPLYAVAASLRGLWREKRSLSAGAAATYVVVIVMMIFNLWRLAGGLPGCLSI